MINGILAYYELTITSEADGNQQTWRIQLTEVNVTGLGMYGCVSYRIFCLSKGMMTNGTIRKFLEFLLTI